jgi:hypothetical protein
MERSLGLEEFVSHSSVVAACLKACPDTKSRVSHEPLEYRDILLLLVEEAAVILITWEGADFGTAENAVAVAGYEVIGCVAEELGQDLHEGCGWTPEAFELLQDEDYGCGAGEQGFVGEFVVEHYVKRVQVAGVGAVAG